MKRLSLFAIVALAFALGAFAATTPSAQAGDCSAVSRPHRRRRRRPVGAADRDVRSRPASRSRGSKPNSKRIPTISRRCRQLAAQFLQINRPDLTVQLTQHLLQSGDKTAQVYYYDGFARKRWATCAARPTISNKRRTSTRPTWACSRSSRRCISRPIARPTPSASPNAR